MIVFLYFHHFGLFCTVWNLTNCLTSIDCLYKTFSQKFKTFCNTLTSIKLYLDSFPYYLTRSKAQKDSVFKLFLPWKFIDQRLVTNLERLNILSVQTFSKIKSRQLILSWVKSLKVFFFSNSLNWPLFKSESFYPIIRFISTRICIISWKKTLLPFS